MVDNGSHTASQLSILVSKVIFCLTEVESHILVFAQGGHLINEQIGYIVWTTCIKVIVEVYKCGEFFTSLYLLNFYGHE